MADQRPTTPLDAATFGALTEALRADLLVHCYRFMGAMTDAEDLVQETLAKAWRGRHAYRGEAGLRTWLRRIATRACLDALRARRGRRSLPSDAGPGRGEVLWLEPLPDDLLAGIESDPAATFDTRESVSLAFLVALQHLPPRQRAALILRDVLALSAAEAAAHIDVTVPALNSLLHRARRTLGTTYVRRPTGIPDAATARLLRDYVGAWERGDVDGLLAVLRRDATLEMPPIPQAVIGHQAIRAFLTDTGILEGTSGRWRGVTTEANGGPAVALYQRTDDGFAFTGIQLLEARGGKVDVLTAYMDASLAGRFRLPPRLT